MKFFFNPDSLLSLPDYGIEIPLTDGRIEKICDLLRDKNIVVHSEYDVKVSREDLLLAHNANFVNRLFGTEEEKRQEIIRTFELINPDGTYHRYNPTVATHPLSGLINKVLLQTSGTIHAVKEALLTGEAFHLGGGYHHSMSFGGRGFCLLNDIVIAARWAQKNLGVEKIWIIDVDAHKGDGTAEITYNDSSIRTMSIHMKHGWPLDSEKFDKEGNLHPWFIESDIDIGVDAGMEQDYLTLLERGLHDLKAIDGVKPQLAIVVQGSDPYAKDELPSSGLLQLSKAQMLKRDILVYQFLKSQNIPQAYVMAGGYGAFAYEIYCQFLSEIVTKFKGQI